MRRLRQLLMAAATVCASQPVFAQQLTEAVRVQLAASLVSQARAFEHGEGAAQDYAEAARLYCDAARYGDAEAQYSLGWMFANARGVTRNDAHAAALFELAAAQGLDAAARALRFVGEARMLPACMQRIERPATAAAIAAGDGPMPGEQVDWDLVRYLQTLPPGRRRIAELVSGLAPRYQIDPRLALAVAATESNFDAAARSPAAAMGVMQLIPDTAARFGVTRPYEPGQNIRGGLSYLRWLLAYYRGDVVMAVAAYNAGEGAVNRYRGIPPYLETIGYVKRVLKFYRDTRHPFDPAVTDASPVLGLQPAALRRGG